MYLVIKINKKPVLGLVFLLLLVTLLHYYTIILSYYYTIILSYYYTIILSYYYTITLSYYYTILLLHYYTILLLHYYIIIVSQYYIDAIKWIKLKKAIKKLRLADQSNYGSVSNSVGDQK